jgi:hypothetical protein
MLSGRATIGSSQSFSMIQRRTLLRRRQHAGEQRRTVVNLRDAAAERRVALHFRQHVREEQHLPVA